MSWDAEGFDKPLILLEHMHVFDAKEQNAYKIEEELEPFSADNPTSELFLQRLTDEEKFKEACDYLAYCIHRRAGVWWSYQCVAAITMEVESAVIANEEQEEKDAREFKKLLSVDKTEQTKAKQKAVDMKQAFQDLEEQLKNNTFTDPNDPRTAVQQQMLAFTNHPMFTKLFDEQQQMMNSLSAEQRAMTESAYRQGEENYLLKYGESFQDAVRNTFFGDLMEEKPETAKRQSLMKREAAKLRGQLSQLQSKIRDKMAVFPLRVPGIPSKPSAQKIDDALESAIRWVMAPTDINAQLALDAGNAANGSPQGMAAFAAFWSSNNLTPGQKQIVLAPPGLASKGVSTSMFLAAMAKGGTKTFEQRYRIFYDIGVDVAQGINVWEEEVFKKVDEMNDGNDWQGKPGFGR